MATFSPAGRIDLDCVTAEIARLQRLCRNGKAGADALSNLMTAEQLGALDPFDRVQLTHIVETCRASRSLSDAGRTLVAASRRQRASIIDADRLRKYLGRFDLSWADVAG